MTGGDERFYAWLDGELGPDDAAEMEARVAADEGLSRLAEQDRALRATLSGAFETVVQKPVPDGLLAAANRTDQSAEVIDFAGKREDRQARRTAVPQWMALAASLAVGVLIGSTVLNQAASGPVSQQSGNLYAAGALSEGLDKHLASAPAPGSVQIGTTYRDKSGAICRTFTVERSSGLACRDQGLWRLQALLASPAESATQFRMAGGIDPALADIIASNMVGEPLDAAAERAAMEAHWAG